MVAFVKVITDKSKEPIEVPIEEDGSLLASKLESLLPKIHGFSVTYQFAVHGTVQGNQFEGTAKLDNGRIYPPEGGWGEYLYLSAKPHPKLPLFFEDEVCRITKNKELQYGMVVQNAEFFSDEESGADDSDNEVLKQGFVRVAWYPKGDEEVIAEDKLLLADRSLMPGDVVSSHRYGRDKVGYCRSIIVQSSVKIVGTDRVIVDVRSEDLTPIEEFSTDLAAYYDGWVGMIKQVELRITAKSTNNVVYKFDTFVGSRFRDITDKRKKDSEFRRSDFYPGQVLVGNYSNLDGAEVIVGEHKKSSDPKSKRKSVRLVVEKVEVDSLKFRWQCQAHADCDAEGVGKHEQPPTTVTGDEIRKVKMLNVFEPATLQLGDRNFYTWLGNERTMTLEEWKEVERSRIVPGISVPDPANGSHDLKMEVDEPKLDVTTGEESVGQGPSSSDYEDVDSDENASLASAGSSTKGKSKATKTLPLLATKVLKKKKLRRSKQKVPILVPDPKPGDKLVVESLGNESRVTVVWQDGTVEENILSRDLFPVHYLDDQEFFPGDFVIGSKEDGHMYEYGTVKSANRAERTVTISWFKLAGEGNADSNIFCGETEVSAYEVKDHPDYKYRPGSCVIRIAGDTGTDPLTKAGQVLDNLPKGKVLVWWVNGTTSECDPQQLYRVGDYDSEAGELWEDNASEVSEGGWSTESVTSEPREEGDLSTFIFRCLGLSVGSNDKASEGLKKSLKLLGDLDKHWTGSIPTTDMKAAAEELVNIYKICRSIDRLLNTSHFDEAVFGDLIAKVKAKKSVPFISPLKFSSEPDDQYNIVPLIQELFTPVGRVPDFLNQVTEFVVQRILRSADLNRDSMEMWGRMLSMSLPFSASSVLSFAVAMADSSLSDIIIRVGEIAGVEVGVWVEFFRTEIDTIGTVLCQLCSVSGKCLEEKRTISLDEIKDILQCEQGDKNFIKRFFVITDSEVRVNFGELNSFICKLNKVVLQLVEPDEFSKAAKYYKKLALGSFSRRTEILNIIFAIICGVEWASRQLLGSSNPHFVEKAFDLLTSCVFPAASSRFLPGHMEHRRYLCDLAVKVAKQIDATEEIPSQRCDNSEMRAYCLRLNELLQTQIRKVIAVLDKEPSANGEATVENGVVDNAEEKMVNGESLEDTVMEPVTPLKEIEPLAKAGTYLALEVTPPSHRFKSNAVEPKRPKVFLRAVREEILLLSTSLPEGIHVRSFEDRSDLFSVMIEGPTNTPYEDGLFFFDFQLPADYPLVPPTCHYYAYCKDRLNPNLYEEGKVCVSLLGTWNGRGSEVWNPGSNLLQVLVSIQGLILNSEPYYNEAGYERQRGTEQAHENSRLYNEMVYLKMAQSMANQFANPHPCFKEEVVERLKAQIPRFVSRIKRWMMATLEPASSDFVVAPDFPLFPLSRGFCLAIQKWLSKLEEIVKE